MIVGNDLADNIIAKIENKKQNHQNIIATQITKYIIMNLQVMGIYNGVLPIGSPDPLSGPVQFKITNCFVDSNILSIKSKLGFQLWYGQILKQIKLSTMIINSTNGIMLNIPSKIFLQIIPSIFSRPNEFEGSWEIICKYIVNDLKKSIINNIPINTTSISGGTGVVVLTNIK